MRQIDWKYQGERFQITSPALQGHSEIFSQMAYAYWASAKKKSVVLSKLLSQHIDDLLKEYLQTNSVKLTAPGAPGVTPKLAKKINLDESKHVVFLTSGKDSVHLLNKICENFGPLNVLAIYVDRINKSEAVYESEQAPIIASHFGCHFQMIEVTNSISLNRDGHNIGLRDQMILVSALASVLNFGAKTVWYGVTHHVQPPALWTETYEAHSHLLKLINATYDCDLKVRFHCENGVHEIDILKAIVNQPELLKLTSSCYTQKNFREHRHEILRSKFPMQVLYHGCGYCVKCMRINGGILAFTDNFDRLFARWWLEKVDAWDREDETLKALRPQVANKFKTV